MRAISHKSCDQLRRFVLNYTQAALENGRLGDVSMSHSSSRGEESAGSQFDSFGLKPPFRFKMAETDCGHGHGLIVSADMARGF
jgi:hypothetical protein